MSTDSVPIESPLSPFQVVKSAFLNTNKHFIGLVSDISFILLLFICMFVPLWVWYTKTFGVNSPIILVFEVMMNSSLFVVILFMLSLCLFNRINSSSRRLTLWGFTKEVSWPWLVEGVKATVIISLATFCLIIPGIIKSIHYAFFSFVVFFNKDYKEGKISALKHSKGLSKGLSWWILGIYIIAPSVVSSIGSFFSKIVFSQVHSIWFLYLFLVLSVYIICLAFAYLYSILCFMYVIKDQKRMAGSVEIMVG